MLGMFSSYIHAIHVPIVFVLYCMFMFVGGKLDFKIKNKKKTPDLYVCVCICLKVSGLGCSKKKVVK